MTCSPSAATRTPSTNTTAASSRAAPTSLRMDSGVTMPVRGQIEATDETSAVAAVTSRTGSTETILGAWPTRRTEVGGRTLGAAYGRRRLAKVMIGSGTR